MYATIIAPSYHEAVDRFMRLDIERETSLFEATFTDVEIMGGMLERKMDGSYLDEWTAAMFEGWLARTASLPIAAILKGAEQLELAGFSQEAASLKALVSGS